jgi:alkylation response protein AidB-like acyl-CoA dehydrogenase
MNYDLSEEQNIIKNSAHKFLSKECPSEFVRKMAEDEQGFTSELWKGMAELGWMSLLIPEKYEGFGGSFLDLTVLLSEMGYFCLPGPFFSTAVLGGLTFLEAGSEAQKSEVLPALAEGKRFLTLAWVEEDGTYAPEGMKLESQSKNDHYVLSGTKLFVPDAHVADTIICAARTGEGASDLSLFTVDAKSPGLQVELLDTIAADKQCEVVFDKVKVPKDNLLGGQDQAWPVLKRVLLMSAVAKSAEMAGGGRKVMELVVPYTKERKQFGRPVGAFQAVQHHCADMLTYADTIEFMTHQAAWRIGAGLSFEKEASMCKAWVSDSYRKLVALGHQVIGGVGFMEEHDLQLYFKRAKTAELMFGDAAYHREMVAQEMGL